MKICEYFSARILGGSKDVNTSSIGSPQAEQGAIEKNPDISAKPFRPIIPQKLARFYASNELEESRGFLR